LLTVWSPQSGDFAERFVLAFTVPAGQLKSTKADGLMSFEMAEKYVGMPQKP
jgi:hypothetical protein